jgi:hypothetical protein
MTATDKIKQEEGRRGDFLFFPLFLFGLASGQRGIAATAAGKIPPDEERTEKHFAPFSPFLLFDLAGALMVPARPAFCAMSDYA